MVKRNKKVTKGTNILLFSFKKTRTYISVLIPPPYTYVPNIDKKRGVFLLPFALLQLADKFGIKVHYHDFAPPLEGVYWSHPDYPPIIGLSKSLFASRARFRSVLAEEIGHHLTTPMYTTIPQAYYHYRDRLEISRAEYRAMKWAANYLIPLDKLCEAQKKGIVNLWDLAEHFDVTEEMMRFRKELANAQGGIKYLRESMSG